MSNNKYPELSNEQYRNCLTDAINGVLSRLSDTELRGACIIITDMHPEHYTGAVRENLRKAGIAHG